MVKSNVYRKKESWPLHCRLCRPSYQYFAADREVQSDFEFGSAACCHKLQKVGLKCSADNNTKCWHKYPKNKNTMVYLNIFHQHYMDSDRSRDKAENRRKSKAKFCALAEFQPGIFAYLCRECDIFCKARVKNIDRLLQSAVGHFLWSKKCRVSLMYI